MYMSKNKIKSTEGSAKGMEATQTFPERKKIYNIIYISLTVTHVRVFLGQCRGTNAVSSRGLFWVRVYKITDTVT